MPALRHNRVKRRQALLASINTVLSIQDVTRTNLICCGKIDVSALDEVFPILPRWSRDGYRPNFHPSGRADAVCRCTVSASSALTGKIAAAIGLRQLSVKLDAFRSGWR